MLYKENTKKYYITPDEILKNVHVITGENRKNKNRNIEQRESFFGRHKS